MKILFYGINYAPELTGVGKYSGEMGEWLARRGHEVRVITAPPYYPEWQVRPGYSAWRYRREVREGVLVWRCPLWVPRRVSAIRRLVHLATFAASSLPILFLQSFWRPDVVFVIEPTFLCAPATCVFGVVTGTRTWLHVQDFELDAALGLEILPPVLRRASGRIERRVMQWFDRVSSISVNMVHLLRQKGVTPSRAVLFENWVDTKTIFPMVAPSPLRRELGIPDDSIVILYSGNLGLKQGLETLLAAADRMLSHPEIRFVVCGDGAEKARLLEQWGLQPNITWLPLQPAARLNELLNMADIHALPQSQNVADLVMPSKLTGILASGRPVIATAVPGTQVAKVVEQLGLVTPPGDVPALVNAITALSRDSEARKACGEAARKHAVCLMEKEKILSDLEGQLSLLVLGTSA